MNQQQSDSELSTNVMVKHQLDDGEVTMKSPKPSTMGAEVSHNVHSRRGSAHAVHGLCGSLPSCPQLVWTSPRLSTKSMEVSKIFKAAMEASSFVQCRHESLPTHLLRKIPKIAGS